MDKGFFEVVGTLQADGSIMSMTSIAMGDNLGAFTGPVRVGVRVRVREPRCARALVCAACEPPPNRPPHRPPHRPSTSPPARPPPPPPPLPHLSRLIASPHDRPSTRHDAMRSVLRTLALAPCAAIAPRPCPCRLADMAMYSEMVTLTHQFPDLF